MREKEKRSRVEGRGTKDGEKKGRKRPSPPSPVLSIALSWGWIHQIRDERCKIPSVVQNQAFRKSLFLHVLSRWGVVLQQKTGSAVVQRKFYSTQLWLARKIKPCWDCTEPNLRYDSFGEKFLLKYLQVHDVRLRIDRDGEYGVNFKLFIFRCRDWLRLCRSESEQRKLHSVYV